MHDPIRFCSFGSFAHVENQSFLDTDPPSLRSYDLIGTRGLPVPGTGNSIRSRPVWVLPVSWAEEIPLFLPKYGLTWYKTPKHMLKTIEIENLLEIRI